MDLNTRLASHTESNETNLNPRMNLAEEGSTIIVNDQNDTRNDVDLKTSVTNNLFEIQDQALIESLSRQVIVGRGVWDDSNNIPMTVTLTEEEITGDHVQPRLCSFSFPDSLSRNSSFLAAKLANVAYIRADIEFTLKVQATPFVQGSLWVFQTPYSDRTSQARRSLSEHMRSLTSFPGVEL